MFKTVRPWQLLVVAAAGWINRDQKVARAGHPLGLVPRAANLEVLEAMKDHVLAEAKLMGTYGR